MDQKTYLPIRGQYIWNEEWHTMESTATGPSEVF